MAVRKFLMIIEKSHFTVNKIKNYKTLKTHTMCKKYNTLYPAVYFPLSGTNGNSSMDLSYKI